MSEYTSIDTVSTKSTLSDEIVSIVKDLMSKPLHKPVLDDFENFKITAARTWTLGSRVAPLLHTSQPDWVQGPDEPTPEVIIGSEAALQQASNNWLVKLVMWLEVIAVVGASVMLVMTPFNPMETPLDAWELLSVYTSSRFTENSKLVSGVYTGICVVGFHSIKDLPTIKPYRTQTDIIIRGLMFSLNVAMICNYLFGVAVYLQFLVLLAIAILPVLRTVTLSKVIYYGNVLTNVILIYIGVFNV